jgi:hypothetical protein
MKWIQEHLSLHSLKHRPHIWIGAVLLSPLLAGQRVYHHKYHLNYVHAKKLFVFDMLLLLGTLVLLWGTWFWHTYDPEVVDFIDLQISITDTSGTPIDRIPSGSLVHYTIRYANSSDQLLERPVLALILPKYFEIEAIDSGAAFDNQSNTIALPDLVPGARGFVTISGRYLGIPNTDEELFARLTYTQEGRAFTETRHTKLISTLRGSLLTTHIDAPTEMLNQGEGPFSLTLTNTSLALFEEIMLPLRPSTGITLIPHGDGIVDDTYLRIPVLAPGERVTIRGTLKTNVSSFVPQTQLTITPILRIDEANLPQEATVHTIAILSPSATMQTTFSETIASPGDTIHGTLTLTNTGSTDLSDTVVRIPLPQHIIDTKRVNGTVDNGSLLLTHTTPISPNTTVTLPFTLPMRFIPSGASDLQLIIEPTLASRVTDTISYTTIGTPNTPVRIGSVLSLSGHAIYYTEEGDQLGRGPLPPRIGEETRYFAILTIKNNTSRVRNVQFTATLPTHVRFTGKTSVSSGDDIIYHETTRTMSWQTFDMQPFEAAGLYIELGLTPTLAHLGNYVTLIEQLQVMAEDTYIMTDISASRTHITTELMNDPIGRSKGDLVVQSTSQ